VLGLLHYCDGVGAETVGEVFAQRQVGFGGDSRAFRAGGEVACLGDEEECAGWSDDARGWLFGAGFGDGYFAKESVFGTAGDQSKKEGGH
jgi:hypothetical protein